MANPSNPPVLSTPSEHVFTAESSSTTSSTLPRLDDEQLAIVYEIERTVREIRQGRWRRIALQFPDPMLGHAVKVYEGLQRGLKEAREAPVEAKNQPSKEG